MLTDVVTEQAAEPNERALEGVSNTTSSEQAAAVPRALLGVYTAAIFLSAALLFSVQPLFTKLVLPALGGAPAVWSVALVLFQSALLAGYMYAHALTRYLPGRGSVTVHLALLVLAALWLPLGVSGGALPGARAELWMVAMFAGSVAVPFFVLSANAPLLQAWFARTGHPAAKDPYFLYAASNAGSFVSLLSYPFVVEPFLGLSQQTRAWSVLFVALILLVAGAAALLLRSANVAPAPSADTALSTPVRARDAALWVVYSAVPSGLLIAVTAHISTDVAAVPLLWVLPLAVYLLTFVLAFQSKPRLSHARLVLAQPCVLALLVAQLIIGDFGFIWLTIGLNLTALFVNAMVCHGELARRRPAPSKLTTFYLWLSVGGVVGGIFSGLIAPNSFDWILEYPLLLGLALACRPRRPRPAANLPSQRPWLGYTALLALAVGLYAFGVVGTRSTEDATRTRAHGQSGSGGREQRARSFFGVHKVQEVEVAGEHIRVLLHGTTTHGAQLLGEPAATATTKPATIAYFGPDSPMARLFQGAKANKAGPTRVAVVGLGVGTVACFTAPEDMLDFYEIDPEVVRIATDPQTFEFIARCKPDSRIILGDARLTLAQAPAHSYDLIVMDAFTSDAVPVHLLTREAMALYVSKLAPGGLIGAHVMNRQMELVSVVAGIAGANAFGTRVLAVPSPSGKPYMFGAKVAVMAESDAAFGALLATGDWEHVAIDPAQRLWTDDYSNVIGAIWRRWARDKR